MAAHRLRHPQRELSARLLVRAPEIEQTILTRVSALADPASVGDPEYVSGLRAAVSAAVRYGLRGIETGKAADVPIPVELLSQVRSAARNRVPLDTVLRRYVAGHTLLSDFVIQEAKSGGFADAHELQRLVRLQAELFDRVVEVIAAEYQIGLKSERRSTGDDRAECAIKLLAGQLVDTAALAYELSGWHLALLVAGPGSGQTLRDFAGRHDRRLLFVPRAEGISWAWLGGGRRPDPGELDRLAGCSWSERTRIALGEPGEGLAGWRLSHRQALAAFPVALRGPDPFVHYADVALLASALQDDVLTSSLTDLYLAPLSEERDGGATLRETLRAYFAAERNSASAAAALGITRQTVNNRLRVVEERLEGPISLYIAELEIALQLHRIDCQR